MLLLADKRPCMDRNMLVTYSGFPLSRDCLKLKIAYLNMAFKTGCSAFILVHILCSSGGSGGADVPPADDDGGDMIRR